MRNFAGIRWTPANGRVKWLRPTRRSTVPSAARRKGWELQRVGRPRRIFEAPGKARNRGVKGLARPTRPLSGQSGKTTDVEDNCLPKAFCGGPYRERLSQGSRHLVRGPKDTARTEILKRHLVPRNEHHSRRCAAAGGVPTEIH